MSWIAVTETHMHARHDTESLDLVPRTISPRFGTRPVHLSSRGHLRSRRTAPLDGGAEALHAAHDVLLRRLAQVGQERKKVSTNQNACLNLASYPGFLSSWVGEVWEASGV